MAAADKVLYTDGRNVVVTDTMLKVRNTIYRLNGITKFCLWTIQAERWPGVLLVLVGSVLAVCGYLNLLPADVNLNREAGYTGLNTLALWVGAALLFLGILALALAKKRYAVRIGTAEGEKNAVVSTRRDYIAQIVDAIHSAFDLAHTNSPIITRDKVAG